MLINNNVSNETKHTVMLSKKCMHFRSFIPLMHFIIIFFYSEV